MLNRWLIGAVLLGAFASLAILTMAPATFESLVGQAGIAQLVPAATPPLGMTARLLLALVIFLTLLLVAGVIGFGLDLIARRREQAMEAEVPVAVATVDGSTESTGAIAAALTRIEARLAALAERLDQLSQPATNPTVLQTLCSIEQTLQTLQHPAQDPAGGLLARIEAHERRVATQLASAVQQMADLVAFQRIDRTESTPLPSDTAIDPAEALGLRTGSGRPQIRDPETARRLAAAIAELRRTVERPLPEP